MKFSLENLFEFRQLIKHLSAGLRRLTLDDNVEGSEVSVTIGAGLELRVRNPLSFVPTKYIITSKTGNSTISKSNTWTSDYVYFTNHGAASTDATIFLMR